MKVDESSFPEMIQMDGVVSGAEGADCEPPQVLRLHQSTRHDGIYPVLALLLLRRLLLRHLPEAKVPAMRPDHRRHAQGLLHLAVVITATPLSAGLTISIEISHGNDWK